MDRYQYRTAPVTGPDHMCALCRIPEASAPGYVLASLADQGETHGDALPLYVSPLIIHSLMGQLMNFKTFIKHLHARPHPHPPSLLGTDSVRVWGWVEMGRN